MPSGTAGTTSRASAKPWGADDSAQGVTGLTGLTGRAGRTAHLGVPVGAVGVCAGAPVVGPWLAARSRGGRRLRVPEPPAVPASARPVRFNGRCLLLAPAVPSGLVLGGGSLAAPRAVARGRALGRAPHGARAAPLSHHPAARTRPPVA